MDADYLMLWGRHPILETLQGFLKPHKILLLKGARGGIISKILKLAGEKGIPVKRVEKEIIDKMAPQENHQGIIAYLPPYQYCGIPEILQRMQPGKPPFLLLLDHLQDPRNLGSLLRTAAGAGVDGVIIPRDRASGVTPVVFKSSAGALAYIPVARVVNLVREVNYLKKEGFWIMGATPDGEKPFYEADFVFPLVLVLGSEGKGLSRLLRQKCDFLVQIPLAGALSSLNVSVAGALIIYEVFRRQLIVS